MLDLRNRRRCGAGQRRLSAMSAAQFVLNGMSKYIRQSVQKPRADAAAEQA